MGSSVDLAPLTITSARLARLMSSSLNKDLDECLGRLRDRSRVVDNTALAIEISRANEFRERKSPTIAAVVYRELIWFPEQLLKFQKTDKKDLERLLNPTDCRDHCYRLLSSKVSGTTEWIFTQPAYIDWQNVSCVDSINRMLAIVGKPGCGKSVLAATIAETLGRHPEYCSIFFSFSCIDAGRQTLEHLIRTLLWGALDALEPSNRATMMQDVTTKSHPVLTELMEALQKTVALSTKPLWFVIDGVDECDEDKSSFVNHINSILRSSSHARALLVGRVNRVGDVDRIVQITPDLIQSDIETFLHEKIDHSNIFPDDELRNLVFKNLSEGSDGMFLWPQLMLQDLQRSSSKFEVRERLQRLPHGLEQIYNHLLMQLHENLDELELDLAQTTLRLATISYRKLTIQEVCYAYALKVKSNVDEAEQHELAYYLMENPCQRIAHVCRGLVVIDAGTLSLVHFSAKEFLTRPERTWKARSDPRISIFRVDEPDSHLLAGYLCIDYLGSTEYGFPLHEAKAGPDFTAEHPFLDYAAKHMTHHFSKCRKMPAPVADKVALFMRSPLFIAWIELLACLSISDISTGAELEPTVQFAVWIQKEIDQGNRFEMLKRPGGPQLWNHKPFHQSDQWQTIINQLSEMLYKRRRGHDGRKATNRPSQPGQGQPVEPQELLHVLQHSTKLSSQWHIHFLLTSLQSMMKLGQITDPLKLLFQMILKNVAKISVYVLLAIGIFYITFEKFEEAVEIFEAASAKVKDHETWLKYAVEISLAQAHFDLAQFEVALEKAEVVAAWLAKTFGQKHILHNMTLNFIGELHDALEHPEEAITYMEKAFKALPPKSKFFPVEKFKVWRAGAIGTIYYRRGMFVESLRWERSCFESSLRIFGEEHKETIDSSFRLGHRHHKLKNHAESIQWMTRAFEGRKATHGEEHKLTNDAAYRLGQYHFELDHYEESIKWWIRTFERDKILYGELSKEASCSAFKIANAHLDRKQYEESIRWFKQASEGVEIKRAAVSAYHLGVVYTELNRYEEAVDWMTKAFERNKRAYGEASPTTIYSAYKVGRIHITFSRNEQALSWMEMGL